MSKPFSKVRDGIWDQMSLAKNARVKMTSIAGGKATYQLTIDLAFDRDFEKKILASSRGSGVAAAIKSAAKLGLEMFFADEESTATARNDRANGAGKFMDLIGNHHHG